jgi:hypothetical protein
MVKHHHPMCCNGTLFPQKKEPTIRSTNCYRLFFDELARLQAAKIMPEKSLNVAGACN